MDAQKLTISANLILDGIWIGNEASSQSAEFLKKNNIRTIINCTKHIPFISDKRHRAVKVRVPLNDPGPDPGPRQDDVVKMKKLLPDVLPIIHVGIRHGGVLVHCHAGIQRSAGTVAAYFMKYHGHSYDRAVTFVQNRRPQAYYYGESVNFKYALK